MSRIEFPEGFHWGAATASYQIEGAWKADDKGESIWDRFAHTPGRVRDGMNGDRACDSYHRFSDDIALLQQMNLTSYRFSLSWPRIQPTGRGAVVAKGVDYYRRLVDALLHAGIRPLPTLYHWDLPQALEDAGGWPSRELVGRFADYAEIVARALGDRVESFLLFNEPNIFTVLGYGLGVHAPGRRDFEAVLAAGHTVNLAQAEGFRAMKAVHGGLAIGSAFNLSPTEPEDGREENAEAAERYHRFSNYWFIEPALRGRYPEAFDSLPHQAMGMRAGDLERIQVPLDFLGVNLYTRSVVRATDRSGFGLGAIPVGMGGGDGPRTDFGWEVWPDALYDMLVRLSRDFDRPVLEITENGCAYHDGPDATGAILDHRRIDFYRGYLEAVHRAIQQGVDVRGYHAWSLLDNFEWGEGYHQRFGLTHVDFESCERTLKESGRFYGRVAAENGFEV